MVTNLLPSREEASTVFGDPRSLTIPDPVHLKLAPFPTRSLLPSQFYLLCRFSQTLHCISLAPARLDRYPRGFTGHVAHPGRSIRPLGLPIYVASKPRRSGGHKNGFETRLLPTLTRSYPCRFTFYVADPVSSIDQSLI